MSRQGHFPATITMQFKRKTTSMKVIEKKLQILHFIKQNKRHPTVHSPIKEEAKMAWNLKNYTNKLLPSYDPIFDAEIKKAVYYVTVKRDQNIQSALENVKMFVKENGFRPSSETYDFQYLKSAKDYANQSDKAEINALMKVPTEQAKKISFWMNETLEFIKTKKRLPRQSGSRQERKCYEILKYHRTATGKISLAFMKSVRKLMKDLNVRETND